MKTITIKRRDAVRHRVNGSVAFFRGAVEMEGQLIDGFRVQTTASDVGADDVRIQGSQLSLPDEMLASILRDIAVAQERKERSIALRKAAEDREHGHILSRLLPLEAVSDAQRDFAEDRRRALVMDLSSHLHDAECSSPDQVRILELFWREVALETRARFWLDYPFATDWHSIFSVLSARARVVFEAERESS